MIVRGEPSKSLVWCPLTLHRQLELTARAHGDRVALIGPDRRLTWAEVRTEARRFARGLMAAGVGKGDHIAVWLPNQIEWVLAWLGASYIGAVVVPINTRYKLEETRYILNQSDSRLLFLRGSFLGIDYQPMLDAVAPGSADGPCPELRLAVGVGDSPPTGSTPCDRFLESGAAVSEDVLDRAANQVEPDDAAIIVYTSGTTGRPKGAVHSHHVLRNEYSITEWMEIGTHSRILGHMPLFHVAGSFTGICPALITGGALVLMDHWDRTRALELIDREGITSFSGIPTHFIDLLTHPDLHKYDTSTLHSGWIGGASNPREVLEGAVNKLGVRKLYPVYGMTETTSVTTFPRPEDPLDVVFTGKGVPVSDFELKIVDTRSGADLAAGVEGEVCVRGHLVMQGYYKNPEATAAVIDDAGWFHTGDLGVLDDAGYLAITGRKSDMFIVGGSNAYPAEIEAVLSMHPEIVQAYVVGVPDARLGEVGFAFVQRDGDGLDEAGVKAFAKDHLADFKVPRHVRFVEEWPLTATGKIERFRLKEMALNNIR